MNKNGKLADQCCHVCGYAARPMCGWLGSTQISESVF